MKEINLSNGLKAIVDDNDYQELNKYKWHYSHNGYAVRNTTIDGKHKNIYMHRFIMNLNFGDKRCVDHINHNKLDNRRENLRICSSAENQWNRGKGKNNTSNVKGVYKHVKKNKKEDGSIRTNTYWQARIRINGKRKNLGLFPFTETGLEQAKQAYNQAALKYHGEFACLND